MKFIGQANDGRDFTRTVARIRVSGVIPLAALPLITDINELVVAGQNANQDEVSEVIPVPAMPVNNEIRARESSVQYIAVSGSRAYTPIGIAKIGSTTYMFNRKN